LQAIWTISTRNLKCDKALVEFNLGVLESTNTTAVDWGSLKDGMRPDYVRPDAWDAIWSNFTAQVGGTWGSYLSMLDENAAYLGRLGAGTSEISRLLGFEFRQADSLNPIRYLAQTTDAALPAPGMTLTFARAYAQPVSRRYEIGPLGRGWAEQWQYSLTTESDGTVRVTDMTGTPRIFQPDSRHPGSYFSAPGDYGTLVAGSGGSLLLTESDGTLYAFRSDGKLDYVQDPNNNRITCGYSGNLLTSLTHSAGQSLIIAYNAAGRIQSITDSDSRQTVFTYDASNEHLISVQAYDGRVTSYAYSIGQGTTREHALTQITYPDGSHRYFTYDAQGRVASTSADSGAETINFNYDSAGTVTATNALGNPSKFYFDDWGQILKATNALGNSVTLSLDSLRNLKSITDPAGRSYSYEYDAKGNLVRSTDSMGHATSFSYTADYNRLSSLTDANGNLTHYAYDSHGNLTAITYANGSTESWMYDLLGDPTEWTNRRGHVVGFTYNADGQVTRKTYADGSLVDYSYNAKGNLTSTTDSTGTTNYSYNAQEDLTRIDYPGGQWLQFTYDAGGRRASSLDQLGHKLEYHYDTPGRLWYMTNEAGVEVVHYSYDAAGRLIRKDLVNGVYTTYEYDAAGQLLHLVNRKSGGEVLSRFDYTYDSRGRRISMGTSYGSWTYEYDDLGQLTHAALKSTDPQVSDQDLRYIYDALGNRIQTIENGVTTAYTANNMNQYTKVGDTTYTFDADGNLIQETSPSVTTTYSYDDENRLIAVQKGGDSWTYTYDALGQRVASTENGTTTRYVIDPTGLGNVVGEYNGSGNLIAHYDHGFGLLSRIDAAGDSAYYTFDALGSTSELTNASCAILNSYVDAPFGSILRQTGCSPNLFQFVGELGVMAESNGLDYMRARFYSANLGRFLAPDPIGVAGDLNIYRYAGNMPALMVDPNGLNCKYLYSWWGANDWTVNPWFGPHKFVVDDNGVRYSYGATSPWGLIWSVLTGLGLPGLFGVSGRYEKVEDGVSSFAPGPRFSIYFHNCRQEAEGNLYRQYCAPSTEPIKNPDPGNGLPSGGSGISGSGDPNQKTGPSGCGATGYVAPAGVLPYRIDFENEKTATAPAQVVVVTDQLDSNLDWSSFRLAEIGFGDHLITIPSNTQHFETAVSFSYGGVDFSVLIEAGIHPNTGQVYASFYSIVPGTGLPPDVLTGFLPPEDGTGRGMGHVCFTVTPKANLATGTQIRNVALISFDNQLQIATNQIDPHDASKGIDPAKGCLNTIDALPPASQVAALPPQTLTTDFTLSWSGQDDAGGSGIASYDVYVSDNGGSYISWLSHATATSATFSGQPGHTYAFYSVAVDHVGNEEASPAAADAVTMVAGTEITDIVIDGKNTDDTVYVRLDPLHAGVLQVFLNVPPATGSPTFSTSLSSLKTLTLNMLAGKDQVTIDFSAGDPIPQGGLFCNGGGEGDAITIVGSGTGIGSYLPDATTFGGGIITIDGRSISFTGLNTATVSSLSSLTLATPNGNDFLTIDAPAPTQNRIYAISGGIPFTVLTVYSVKTLTIDTTSREGPGASSPGLITIGPDGMAPGLNLLRINAGPGRTAAVIEGGTTNLEAIDGNSLTLVATSSAVVNLPKSNEFAFIAISGSACVDLPGDGGTVLRTGGLSISGNGVLDLGKNDLILQAAPGTGDDVLAQVTEWIKTSGDITSSAAKGDKTGFTGLGVRVNDQGEVVIKYTWNGDANLDGVVNADDYFQIDTGFITQKPGYYNGDFNYDGVINADDYFLIDSAFIGQTGPLATKPRPVETPTAESAEESGEATLVLRASQPNAGVFATREGNWLRDLLAGKESVLDAAE